jgi:putative flippase GtrA
VELPLEADAVTAALRRRRMAEVWRFLRAQVSSALATLVDWVLMLALMTAGVNFVVAVAAGHVAGALTDFSVKKFWAFGAQGGALEKQAGRYLVAWVGSLAINEVLAWLAIDRLSLPSRLSVIVISAVVGFVWNYPMHRYFVFGRHLHLKDRSA